MASIINGSSPTVTFSDGTTQATAGLPLTGGTVTGNLTTSGLTIGSTILGAGNTTRFKNRIINGDMRIDQRNAGASVTASTTGAQTYTLDRWPYAVSQSSKFTIQQNAGSVIPPAGFINYLGVTSTSAYSLISSDYFQISQFIEGLNIADLSWGTANAKTITLSAWVYSSLTGTFGGALLNGGGNRSYPFTYSIPAANTWTQISITIVGDTTGTWLTTNGIGLQVRFSLGMGSTYSGTAGSWSGSTYFSATGATSVVGTSGATLYITGVQLEVGSQATSFEYVDYSTQLQMCQRYYEKFGFVVNSTLYYNTGFYRVTKRTQPTLTVTPNGGSGAVLSASVDATSVLDSFYQSVANSSITGSSVTASAEL